MGKIRNRGRTDVKKGLVRQGNVVGDRHEQREVRGVVQEVEYRKSNLCSIVTGKQIGRAHV